MSPGRVAQSVASLTHKPEVRVRYPVRPHTFVSPSVDSRRQLSLTGESMCNRLGGLGLSRKSVVRLTCHPDMTTDVYRGPKMTT